jgi:hypothetical protein
MICGFTRVQEGGRSVVVRYTEFRISELVKHPQKFFFLFFRLRPHTRGQRDPYTPLPRAKRKREKTSHGRGRRVVRPLQGSIHFFKGL